MSFLPARWLVVESSASTMQGVANGMDKSAGGLWRRAPGLVDLPAYSRIRKDSVNAKTPESFSAALIEPEKPGERSDD